MLYSVCFYAQCTGCDFTLNSNSNNYTFATGKTCVDGTATLENAVTFGSGASVCIKAGSVLNFNNVNNFNFPATGDITYDIYGTLNINGNPTFGKNIHFNVHSGGKLIAGNMKFEGSFSSITNNGETYTSNIELGNGKTLTIDNYKTMHVQGNMNLSAGTSFVRNQDQLDVTSNFGTSAGSLYINCGDFEGQFNLGGGNVINTGRFISQQIDMGGNSNGRFDNYGYVLLTGNLNMGGLNSVFYNQGIVDASTGNANIQSDGNLKGPNTGKGYFLLRSQTVMNHGNIGPNLNFTINSLGASTVRNNVFNNSLTVETSVTFGEAMPPLSSLPAVTCPNIDGTFPVAVCYKPAATSGTTLETKHGITALSRAGAENGNWPMERKGAWTVLESKTKGFVVNRVSTTNALTITNPIEGMMVYDEQAECLKIYTIKEGETSAAWHCLTKQTCPD